MPVPDLFTVFTTPLDELGLSYIVTGSVAGIVYGEPRMTHDIDLVLDLGIRDVDKIPKAFPLSDFYCPPEETLGIEAAREQRGHFNIIHHETGFKADVYLKGNHPLHEWAFCNKRSVELPDGNLLWIAPPEYVIIRKLEFFREGKSEKHLRDILGIVRVSGDDLDQTVLKDWISRLGLEKEWKLAKE